jgi:hypothetical protein
MGKNKTQQKEHDTDKDKRSGTDDTDSERNHGQQYTNDKKDDTEGDQMFSHGFIDKKWIEYKHINALIA